MRLWIGPNLSLQEPFCRKEVALTKGVKPRRGEL